MRAKRDPIADWASKGSRVVIWVTAIGSFLGGCSTTELAPAPVPTMRAPEYIQVPHPAGFEVSDIQAIFIDKRAMPPEKVAKCDADWRKLRSLTDSEDELKQGAGELIKQDPTFYHWCFYGKIVELEKDLKTISYVDDRQKKVLDTYAFLVPVAKAYMREFHDSRYMRWAIRHYRGLSEWVFFRKLDQAPRMTADLVEVANPFGAWRDNTVSASVLERYHLVKSPDPDPSAAPKSIFPPTESAAETAAPTAASAAAPAVTAPAPVIAPPPGPAVPARVPAAAQAPSAATPPAESAVSTDPNRFPATTGESAEPTVGVQKPVKIQP